MIFIPFACDSCRTVRAGYNAKEIYVWIGEALIDGSAIRLYAAGARAELIAANPSRLTGGLLATYPTGQDGVYRLAVVQALMADEQDSLAVMAR